MYGLQWYIRFVIVTITRRAVMSCSTCGTTTIIIIVIIIVDTTIIR